MDVLVACKNEEDQIKNEGARVVTTLFIDFSDAQGQLTPKSMMESCRNSIPSQHFSHYRSMGIFLDLQGQVPHKSLIRSYQISNPSRFYGCPCKNEEDPIKNEGAIVVTTFFIDFSNAQGQFTPKSMMESCQNSNPSKLLWLTLLPARMKRIHLELKALERSQFLPL